MKKNPLKSVVFMLTLLSTKSILSQPNVDVNDPKTSEALDMANKLLEMTEDDAKAHDAMKRLLDAHEKGEDVSKIELPDFI